MRTVLVTGIDGFTGRYVAAELQAAGYKVVGLGSGKASGQYYHANLLDADALAYVMADAQPDFIINLAAIAFVAHGDANAFYQVNVIGARNLLQAALNAKKQPRSILMVSSANVYGNATVSVIDENIPMAPVNDYAVSKLAMEYMTSLYIDKLPITIVRPFNYTGVGQAGNFLIPKIVDHFRRKAPIIELGNLDVSRDFGDARAVASAYRLLLQNSEAQGRVVNICSGQAYALEQIIQMCASVTGHEIQVKVNLDFVRENEIKVLRGDNTLLQVLAGPQWRPIPLEATLEWMLSQPE
ncbi:NAD-dependent epimerase/dehydratase [Pusillimonas sp. T7-7]|uniref:NAD-dependent epimerase/dehydratase family protein n=1 Tax=Pusillimonas sp. (strain T7-7) TaxID=1007105 RepID=UPI0002084BAD|nr:NAD-dependent epimerase/dehydratase family protein [Pusillimonas sp. T7-7]AEC21706.1 NAD-dependent epimerase/dehydratase [Pusillimonas sp. T7-7]